MKAIRLVYPPLFCKLRSSSNPTNKNLPSQARIIFKQVYLGNNLNYTHVDMIFVLTMTYTITSKNIDFYSWITLYKIFEVFTSLFSFKILLLWGIMLCSAVKDYEYPDFQGAEWPLPQGWEENFIARIADRLAWLFHLSPRLSDTCISTRLFCLVIFKRISHHWKWRHKVPS